MRKPNTYRDTLHGLTVESNSKMSAWALIRNKCVEYKIPIPQLNQIIQVK